MRTIQLTGTNDLAYRELGHTVIAAAILGTVYMFCFVQLALSPLMPSPEPTDAHVALWMVVFARTVHAFALGWSMIRLDSWRAWQRARVHALTGAALSLVLFVAISRSLGVEIATITCAGLMAWPLLVLRDCRRVHHILTMPAEFVELPAARVVQVPRTSTTLPMFLRSCR